MTIKIFAIVPDTSTEQEGSFKVADSDYRVPEGTTAMYAAFAIDPATGSPRASQPGGLVNITFTDGSAKTADNDYSADNRQLALGQIFTAEALDDYVADNNESFNVSVSRFTNEASFSSVTYINAVTVIVDDSNPDTPDTPDEPNQEVVLVRIAGPATVIEGNTTTNYTVTLTETPVTDVTVKLTYTGTATDGTDYTKEVSVVVPAGSKTATFDLATIDDVYADNGETIIVTLGQITGGGFESIKADPTKDSVTTTILDDSNPDTPDTPDEPNQEVVLVSIAGPATVIEGNTTTNYTVTLTETPVTDVTVKLTYTGTATDGTDYTKDVEVTVPAGSKTATFDLATIDDVYADNGETIIVTLGQITGGGFESIKADSTKDSVTTTILDDSNPDTPDTPDEPNQEVVLVSIAGPATVFEGNTTTNYTVSLTETPLTAVTVKLTYTGTATDGTDYTKDVQVTVPAGSKTATFDLATIVDTIPDNGETIIVTLGQITGGGFEDIRANTTANTVTTTILDAPIEYTFKLFAANGDGVPLTDGNGNYVSASQVNEDAANGPTSAHYVVLAVDGSGAPLSGQPSGTVGIGFNNNTAEAEDYTGAVSRAEIGKVFTATATDDVLADNGETFVVSLVGGYSGTETVFYDPSKVTTTILDETDNDQDDPPPPNDNDSAYTFKLFASDAQGNIVTTASTINEEGQTSAYYVVKAVDAFGNVLTTNQPPTGTVEVSFTNNGSTSDGDYTKSVTTTAAIGSAFSSTAINDALPDNGETFTVRLVGNYRGAAAYEAVTYDPATVTTTITDADLPALQLQAYIQVADAGAGTVSYGGHNWAKVGSIGEESNTQATYTVLALDATGTPRVSQPGGDVTISYAAGTPPAEGGGVDYTAPTTSVALGGTFNATAFNDAFPDSGEKFTISVTDLTTKSNYATVGFGDAVTTTITDADLPAPSLKAWSDVVQSDQGELDQGDNTAKTFTVTQQQLSNQADANNKWFDGGIGTMLAEGQSLASVANQYAPRDITLAFTAPVTFTFINEVGDYHSVIGWYNKNEPGVGHVVWADAGVGSSSFTTPTPMPQGTDLGFFMISNGSPPNNVSIPETVYFKGGVAYTEPDGAGTLLKSAGGSNQVWFSNNPNGDGQQHVVTGLDADDKSLLYVGFEDLNNGGDKDYNDVVFKVDLGDANKLIADPVTFDLGVDIDDRSALLGHVTVAFDLGLNDEVFFGSVAGLQVSGPVVNPGTGFTTYTIDNALNPSDLINAGDAEDLLDSFKILVGNTSPSGEYANVDYADRTAEVRMFSAEVDALGQAIELGDPAHAIFQLVKDQNNPV